MSALRIGWIGCGTHANEMLLPQLMRHDVRPRGALRHGPGPPRRAPPRASASRRRTPTRDWRALLAQATISTRSVLAVGPQGPFRDRPRGVERGLPVFLEKPPAPTAAEAWQLAEAAEQAGVTVAVGFMKRYSTANRIALNIVDSRNSARGRASSAST